MKTLNKIILAGALALGMGSAACSDNYTGMPLASKTYEISVPRRHSDGKYLSNSTYQAMANDMTQRFDRVIIRPNVYECRDRSEKGTICEEMVIFDFIRNCNNDSCDYDKTRSDREAVNMLTAIYNKQAGNGSAEITEIDSLVKKVEIENPSKTLPKGAEGNGEDLSDITQFPNEPERKCCEKTADTTAATE